MFQAKTSQESAIPGIYSVPWAGLREDPSGFLQALENCWILWPLLHNAGAMKGIWEHPLSVWGLALPL